mmetsp:Transcript_7213/g.12182  ORF Transcript_7213/g.12182 Transcript_7213/m.12182 type:complete len:115 (-) Transcript_7213:549-893(-)
MKPNQYDVLWPNNMKQVMGESVLTWWIPFYQPEMKGWGFYFPQLPKVYSPGSEVGILQKDGKISKKEIQYDFDLKDQFESDPMDYIRKAEKKYAGFTFILPGESEGEAGREVRI